MENYIQYNVFVMPSSDHSTKCSNLNAEQTWVLVFTILSNSVKDCIIDLKKKKKSIFLHFWFASSGCAPVLAETTIIVLSFMKLTLQISWKYFNEL